MPLFLFCSGSFCSLDSMSEILRHLFFCDWLTSLTQKTLCGRKAKQALGSSRLMEGSYGQGGEEGGEEGKEGRFLPIPPSTFP